MDMVTGREVIPRLAERYSKLYLSPYMDNLKEEYESVALCGGEPEDRSLSHFHGSDEDELVYEETPAGEVLTVKLADRRDFEMLLNIMLNKCVIKEIPKTQGASILDGVINWNKINARKEEFIREEKAKGIEEPDWDSEFTRFTSERSNFREALIVLSAGPYSAIPAAELHMDEAEWNRLSHIIRKYHECTHFICRRLYREKINAVWDELVADAVGIYAAFGRFDIMMEERFLGITDGKYTGGRLENYVKEKNGIDELAAKAHETLIDFDKLIKGAGNAGPYDIAILLEESYQSGGRFFVIDG
ncbi:MAG: hypothetical protein J5966_04920 [Lachnospiraceae bacterium]|nr:hypothetical protein [Lachnospiraceae bacterium]